MFNIIKGQESSALLQSFKYAAGQVLEEGDWVVFNDDGTVSKQAGAYDGAKRAYPVWGGNKVRFDSKQLGVVTICMGTFYAETSKIAAVAFKPGDRLTLLDGVLTVAAAGDTAKVIVGDAMTANVSGVIEFVRL
jgi:hypothetical protein